MKNTIKNNNTRFHRSIAAVLLLCQLLTSCSGSGEEIGPNFQGSAPSSAVVPEASSVAEAVPAPTPVVESEAAAAEIAPAVGVDASLPLLGNLADGEALAIQRIEYINMAGQSAFIEVDLRTTTIGEFLEAIKQQDGLVDRGCLLVYKGEVYKEDDTRLLHKIVDLTAINEGPFTIVRVKNSTIAKNMLGANYVGEEAWQQLGILEEGQASIELPILSDAMLAEIKRLQTVNQEPLLVLDLGKSIEEMERLCTEKVVNVLDPGCDQKGFLGNRKLRVEDCYRATGPQSPRWLLLPGSDHGVLPGSRNKKYAEQVRYMNANYPGYEVGGARELVTIAMLKFLQDGTVLFPSEPRTVGNCKEEYETGEWYGYYICLGAVQPSSPSVFGGLVVASCHVLAPGDGLFVFQC